MKNIDRCYFMLIFTLLILFSCSHKVTSRSSAPGVSSNGHNVASAPCIIYKTKTDYFQNVPVTLNDKKSFLSSYPDIKDIYFNGKLAYPTQLANGFLLDNRGIGPNVAFLIYTYEDYQKLTRTPTADELMKKILDNDPITEMYQCGTRIQYQDMEKELNKLITSGNLNTCKKIK
jgi:hypothetical protein